jgi:NAD(P)-dependent dehydrogenase (short-subunit alcohol dehydrogenase family)
MGRELAIVCGASKGFGRAICLSIARKFKDVDFLLITRSVSGEYKLVPNIQMNHDFATNTVIADNCFFLTGGHETAAEIQLVHKSSQVTVVGKDFAHLDSIEKHLFTKVRNHV